MSWIKIELMNGLELRTEMQNEWRPPVYLPIVVNEANPSNPTNQSANSFQSNQWNSLPEMNWIVWFDWIKIDFSWMDWMASFGLSFSVPANAASLIQLQFNLRFGARDWMQLQFELID